MSTMHQRILCFGDSITRGRIPGSLQRHKDHIRRTGVLQQRLGNEYVILEEGLRGRTLGKSTKEGRSGLEYFYPCVLSHLPLDTIIISLGTNDILGLGNQFIFQINDLFKAYNDSIIKACNEFQMSLPKIIVVTPPLIDTSYIDRSLQINESERYEMENKYTYITQSLGWHIFKSAEIVGSGIGDGIHLNEQQNQLLAEALESYLSKK